MPPESLVREVWTGWGGEGCGWWGSRTERFMLMQFFDVSSGSMTAKKPHGSPGGDSCCLVVVLTGKRNNSKHICFYCLVCFLCLQVLHNFLAGGVDQILDEVSFCTALLKALCGPACADLPGLTWTPSVAVAASSLAPSLSAMIWNPPLMARAVGWAGCGYVEGGNPAV